MDDGSEPAEPQAPTLGTKLGGAIQQMVQNHQQAMQQMAEQHQADMANMAQNHQEALGQIAGALKTMSGPKRVIRGPDGRAVGVEPIPQTQTVQ